MEKKEKTIIAGSNINLESPDFKDVRTLADLQKLNIFKHLSGKLKEDAENELLAKLNVNSDDEEREEDF
jgi:hypothetical protein